MIAEPELLDPVADVLNPEAVQARAARSLLRELAEFCLGHGGKWCYAGWPLELLEAYLAEMARRKTMVWMRGEDDRVAGVGVAWRCWEWQLRAAVAKGQHAVDAATFDPEGDTIFFADWVVRAGWDRMWVMGQLLRALETWWPGWRGLKYLSFRRGKLVRLERMSRGLDARRWGNRGGWGRGK